jgi:hypothetical protein
MMPSCRSFSVAPSGMWVRRAPPLASTSRGYRRSTLGLHMSDMGDMTMEMMRRLGNTLHELSPADLSQLQGLCNDLSSKIDTVSSSPKAAKPIRSMASNPAPQTPSAKPAAFVRALSALSTKAEDHDSYFGVDEGPINESGEPLSSKPAPAAAPKASTIPAKQPQAPVVKQEAVKPKTPEPTKPKAPAPKPVPAKAPAPNAQPGSRFSKYLPDEKPAPITNLATDEALCDEETWNQEYIKEFGMPPNNDPISDVDSLNAPRGMAADPKDAFAKVREVQANAASYPSPQDYYDALNKAMQEWKNQRLASGKMIGSITSDRYIDQLANSAPDSANFQQFGQDKKFTFDAMFNEVTANDENGNPATVLQFTQVRDKPEENLFRSGSGRIF